MEWGRPPPGMEISIFFFFFLTASLNFNINLNLNFRLIKKKYFGTVFNFHYAMAFILKGLLLPLSFAVNIVLLCSPEIGNTETLCYIMRSSQVLGVTQNGTLSAPSFIFR